MTTSQISRQSGGGGIYIRICDNVSMFSAIHSETLYNRNWPLQMLCTVWIQNKQLQDRGNSWHVLH